MRSSPAALPPRLAILAALGLFAPTACESAPSPPQRTDTSLQGESVRAVVAEHGDGRLLIEIEALATDKATVEATVEADAAVRAIRLATVDRVRLVLADSSGERLPVVSLPFRAAAIEDDTLVVRCAPNSEHRVEVRFRVDGPDGLRVDVTDRVGLRSSLFELTLDYRLEVAAPLDEAEAPHLHEALDELVGDIAFHTPIAFTREGTASLGLVVDTRSLLEERRLPQGLELRPQRRLLRHGLIRYRLREDREVGGTRCTRDGALPVPLRNESVRFAHTLRTSAVATADTRDRLHADLWRSHDAAMGIGGARSGPLGDRSIEERIDSLVDDLVRDGWRDIEGEGESLRTAWVGGPTDDLADSPTRTRFGVRHQALRTAYAIARSRADRGLEPDPRIGGLVNLVISAPRRGGMIPSLFEVDAGGGGTRWSPESDDGPQSDFGPLDRSGGAYFHAFDAACTGYWLLLLSDLLPSRSAKILSTTGELARFLVQNQRASGSIPSFYSADELLPLRTLFDDDSTECGASALFLVEYSRRTRDAAALRAAERAVTYLGQRDRTLPWSDFETLAPSRGGGLQPAPGVEGTLGLLFAARAAFEVADLSGATSFRELGEDLCEALAKKQHGWSPDWMAKSPRGRDGTVDGAIRATNRDLVLGDARAALAADAFLRAYRATGRHDFLQRGIRALRGALARDDGYWTPGGGQPDESDWGRVTAAAIALRNRDLLGQAVVDVAGGFAEGIDAVWFEDLEIAPGKASFRLLSYAKSPRPVRVHFRGIPRRGEPIELRSNGGNAVIFGPDELREGIELLPASVAQLAFTPPAMLRAGAPWTPDIRFDGDLPLGTRARVEYVARDFRSDPAVIPLESGVGNVLPAQRPDVMSFELGTMLEAWAYVETPDGRVERLPRNGVPRRIVIGDMDCVDVGDGDEAELEDAGESTVEPFVDGRELARRVAPGDRISYQLRVPRTATEVHLRLRVSGAARITSGARLLYADDRVVDPQPRSIELELADPRLWRQDGRLGIQLQAVAGGDLQLARILSNTEGRSTPLGARGEAEVPAREIDSRLRVWVLPLALSDSRVRTSSTDLNRVVFGGSDYRRTPAPEPRNTTGSVATLISEMSGGTSELRGDTLNTLEVAMTTDELRNATPETVATLCEEIEANLSQIELADAVIVVCPDEFRRSPATDAAMLRLSAASDPVPALFLTERSPDGSILASGTAITELLRRLYGFEDLGHPETGNFGEFGLSWTDADHTPGFPSGPNLSRAGWADVVRVNPIREDGRGQETLVGVSPLRSSKTILRLPTTDVPGRGDLFVETHERSTAEPWAPTSGALVYWGFDDPDSVPTVRAYGGRTTRAARLRLSPSRPSWRTPFVPADAADLFRTSARLDGESSPSIATLRGEVVWEIRRMRTESTDGAVRLWLGYLPIDVLQNTPRPIWSSGSPDGYAPLIEAQGSVERIEPSGDQNGPLHFRIETKQARARTSIRGRFDLPMGNEPRRVFGLVDRLECNGSARLRVSTGPTIHIDTPLAEPGVTFEFDLAPSEGSDLTVEVIQLGVEPVRCRLAKLLVTPRQAAEFPARFPDSAYSVALCDGTTYGRTSVITIDENGVGRVSSPVVVPRRASALRMVLGLGADDRETSVVTSAVIGGDTWWSILDDHEFTRRADQTTPLSVILAELPEDLLPGVHFLDVEFRGLPGEQVHVVSVGIEES